MSEDYVGDSDEDAWLLDDAQLPLSNDASSYEENAPQPSVKSYLPSSISQFPSTSVHATQDHFESPIEQFSVSGKSSVTHKRRPKERRQSAVSVDPEIIDLSDELDEDLPTVAKKSKKSEQDSVKKDKKKKKKRKDDSKVDFAQGVDEDNEGAPDIALSAWKPENVTFSDDELLLKKANKEKKCSKKRKDEDPSTSKRSKKRKSPEVTDMEISSLKSKKRRRIMTDPSEHDSEPAGSDNDEDIDIPRKESDALDNVKVPASTSGEGNQGPQAYSSFNGENMQLPDNQDPSNEPKSDVDSTNSTKKDTSKEVPPPKPAPRKPLENNPSTQHYIPKRGSISGLLKKTGLHAPLSSSKIVRSTSNRIAPLHISRRTPPPPPPPIPKPKKKVEADDEDEPDFTGMTQKQIDKYWEEKKKRAWYSP